MPARLRHAGEIRGRGRWLPAAGKPRTTASSGPVTPGSIERRTIHGKENHWLPEASGAGRLGDPVARRSAPRSVSAVSTSWNSARRSTPHTQEMEKGSPDPGRDHRLADKSFTFEMKLPPVTYFIKKAVNLKSGTKLPGKESAGTITAAQIREIAEKKMKDLNADNVDAAMSMIAGSARSMGIQVEG